MTRVDRSGGHRAGLMSTIRRTITTLLVALLVLGYSTGVGYAHWTVQSMPSFTTSTGLLSLEIPTRSDEYSFECEVPDRIEESLSFTRFWVPWSSLEDPASDGPGAVTIGIAGVEDGDEDHSVDPPSTRLGELGPGGAPVTVYLDGTSVEISGWVEHAELPGRYIGFSYEVDGSEVVVDIGVAGSVRRVTLAGSGMWTLDQADDDNRDGGETDSLCEPETQAGGFTVVNSGSIPTKPYFEVRESSGSVEDGCTWFDVVLDLEGSGEEIFDGSLCDLLDAQMLIVPQLDPGEKAAVDMDVVLARPPRSQDDVPMQIEQQLSVTVTLVQWNSGASETPGFIGWSAVESWIVDVSLSIESHPDDPQPVDDPCESFRGACEPVGSPCGSSQDASDPDDDSSSQGSSEASDEVCGQEDHGGPDGPESKTDSPSSNVPIDPNGESGRSDGSCASSDDLCTETGMEGIDGAMPETDPPASAPGADDPTDEGPESDPIAASLIGQVWNDLDGDGVWMSAGDEPGMSMVAVVLRDDRDREIARVMTDDDGSYVFAGLQPGIYLVEFLPLTGFGFVDANESDPTVRYDYLEHVALVRGVGLEDLVTSDVVESALDATGIGWGGVTRAFDLVPGTNLGFADAALLVTPRGVAETDLAADTGAGDAAPVDPNAVATEPDGQPILGSTVLPDDASGGPPAPTGPGVAELAAGAKNSEGQP